MINHRHKFVFVHINKCAGQSIRRTLPRGKAHRIAAERFSKECGDFGYRFGK